MKRMVLCVAFSLASAICNVYGASIGVFVGYQDTGDAESGVGAGLEAAYPVALDDRLAVRVRAGRFTGFESDCGSIQVGSDGVSLGKTDVDMTPIEAGISYEFNLGGKSTFSLGGGIGYYLFSLDGKTKQVSSTVDISTPFGSVPTPYQATVDYSLDNSFGFYTSAGINVGIGENLALFFNARYLFLDPPRDVSVSGAIGRGSASHHGVHVTTQGESFAFSGSDNLDFGGLGADIGILWKW